MTGDGLGARLASAAVLIPLVVLVVWVGGTPLAVVAGVVAGRTCFELLRLLRGRVLGLEWLGVLVAGGTAALPVVVRGPPWPAALALLVCLTIVGWSWLACRAEIEQGPARVSALVFACLICGTAFLGLVQLRARPDGRAWLLDLLLAVWLNDTCAYLGGRAMGRHRLAPLVSPGKTWEGWAFGTLGTCAGLAGAAAARVASLAAIDAVALALAVSALGPLGDLSKSLLKRARGVKDAGRLIPGHGGMLDRVDSLLFTVPVVLLYLELAR